MDIEGAEWDSLLAAPDELLVIDFADCDGNARVRRSEDSRGPPEAEAQLLPREPALQQLVVHAESRAASGVGVPGSLGEQAHRHRRSGGAGARTNEPTERARLADVARLSVALAEVAP